MQSIVSTSPDGSRKAVLEYADEIRFGPAYYHLKVDNISFGGRVFGDSFLWSPDSRFFAVQEWETTGETLGPKTRLLLIDLEARRECVLSRVDGGFIVPKQFEGGKLIYTKRYHGKGIENEFEIEFPSLNRWENLE
ncbi:MAG: hypothetical protein L6Q26_08570 [Anaerolineales bacterium]|nr:hypothetical protein [Anaerolineales bacterium]NUQ84807.1 hypothetical protein [Anaerolineales bacterium]